MFDPKAHRDQVQWHVQKVDRRTFMRATGLAGAGFAISIYACKPAASTTQGSSGETSGGSAPEPAPSYNALTTFVSVGSDGSAQITVTRSEMGQGVRTSMAMLVAEELGVDWNQVRVIQADADPRYGDQNTDGSRSVRLLFEPLRTAGAQAREMLVAAASAQWGLSPADLTVKDGAVHHPSSGRSLPYAQLVGAASELPSPEKPSLTSPADFRIIGKRVQGIDNLDIATGKAVFGIDAELDGMLHASIERAPTVGGEVEGYDEQAAMAVPGVRKVVKLEATDAALLVQNGVAVLADHTWAAIQGRVALKATWKGGDAKETTAAYRGELEQAVKKPLATVRDVGDVDKAFKQAKDTFEAEYSGPHLAHAPMEPPVALASVKGSTAEIWGPIQDPSRAAGDVAKALKIKPEAVTVHVTLLGGGFGRKSQPDYVIEAAKLSQAVGAPVKVTWTREDDIRHGFYRPENRQLLRAAIGKSGEVSALHGRSLFPSLLKVFAGSSAKQLPLEVGMGWTNWPYAVDNMRAEAAGAETSLRVGWWRSVCHTFHAFSMGSFLDELAHKAGKDPITHYKQMVGAPRVLEFAKDAPVTNPDGPIDTGRLLAVVDRVASMGLWGTQLPKGEGLGFAAHVSFRSYIACVMHVTVDDNKRVRVKAVDYAVDVGRAVNPDGIAAQVEGGFVFGLTAAAYSEITVKEGVVQESNFDTYKMLRINKMPKVRVAIIESDAPPTGIGEPPTPPVAPALANAIFAANGERIRELPVSRAGYRV
ncbi:MAG: molybdopterin-dependent oxidoreductase [Myxococcales bacterium]|nr:molybdopterin-dependent oxidoreductase [Myxococcales bacterium]